MWPKTLKRTRVKEAGIYLWFIIHWWVWISVEIISYAFTIEEEVCTTKEIPNNKWWKAITSAHSCWVHRKLGYLIRISPQYLVTIPDLTIMYMCIKLSICAEFWDLHITFLSPESADIFSCISYTSFTNGLQPVFSNLLFPFKSQWWTTSKSVCSSAVSFLMLEVSNFLEDSSFVHIIRVSVLVRCLHCTKCTYMYESGASFHSLYALYGPIISLTQWLFITCGSIFPLV